MKHRFSSHRHFAKRFKQPVIQSASKAELLAVINSVQVIKKERKISEEISVTKQFDDFSLPSELLKNIKDKGYITPTPIQQDAIFPILKGKDVIGIANTGTGKTAAFLIPLISIVFLDKSAKVLIIAPTRELAVQIQDELQAFSKNMGIKSALCIGGMSLNRQKEALKRYPHFVIGTPGRIKDLIQERSLMLAQFTHVVLDETDRMVDIGFISDIKYFISLLPQDRQSLFFSATVPPKVKDIRQVFVHDAITISVKTQEHTENIHQDIITVEAGYRKIDKLHDLLSQKEFEKVVIFGRTKWGIQKLTNELIKRGFKAGAIHGNKNQNQRQRILQEFKNNTIHILLATDVASRGLDIPDVTHVINYDMPASMDDYTHRIGRTGRANKRGVALTFVE